MRADNPRTGYPDSGTVAVTAGDGNTPQTAVDVPDVQLYRPTQIVVSYDNGATNEITLAFFDDADGTTAGNVSDRRFRVRDLQPGETFSVDDLDMREFENDVLVQEINGNQDGTIDVTVFGEQVIGLYDVLGGS